MTVKVQVIVRIQTGVWPEAFIATGDSDGEYATETGAVALQWLRTDDLDSVHRGSVQQFRVWYQSLGFTEEAPVILLVPGTFGSFHHIFLQGAQKKHWQQALPFLVEEKLAADLESQHLVAMPGADNSAAIVGCIDHGLMRSLLDFFHQHDIELQKMLPEAQLIPEIRQILQVWLDGPEAWVSYPGQAAQKVDLAALEVLLPALITDPLTEAGSSDEDTPEADSPLEAEPDIIVEVHIYAPVESESEASVLAGKLTGLPVEVLGLEENGLFAQSVSALLSQTDTRKQINYRTGLYKSARRSSRLWKLWKPVAVAASVCLVADMALHVGSGVYFQSGAEQLKGDNLALYQEIVPGDKTVVDVRDRLLKVLKKSQQPVQAAAFLEALQILSRVTADNKGKVVPKSLDFNDTNGKVSLDVTAGNFEDLNRYLEALRAAGLKASMETGNKDKQGIVARLTMRKA